MAGNCYKCSEPCILKESKREMFGYPCDQCRRIICRSCAGLSSSEVRAVVISTRVMPFYCVACRESSIQVLIKRVVNIEQRIQEQTSNLNEKFVNLEHRILKMEQTNDTLIEQRIQKIEQLMESNKQIEKEVNDIKNIMESRNDVDCEEIINEMMERKKRLNNVIMLNIKESGIVNKLERDKEEKDVVKKILAEGDVTLENFKVFRLGKYEVGKTRPIKVVFNNSEESVEILKKKRAITEKIPSIRIFRDQTPKQREYFKKVQGKLQDLINSGDKGKSIKYINNIPTIVNKSGHSKNSSQ